MSFLGKLQFWKRRDEFSLPETNDMPDLGISPGGMPDNLGLDNSSNKMIDTSGTDFVGADSVGTNSVGVDPMNQSMQTSAYPAQPALQSNSQISNPLSDSKDMDLISSKLDTIKAELDAMNQRLKKIEHLTEQSVPKKDQRQTVW